MKYNPLNDKNRNLSDNVKEYRNKVADTAEKNENMKNGMDISALFTERIEDRSDGICNAAAEKPCNSPETDNAVKRFESKNYDPAHCDICNIGNYFEFVYIDSVENDSENGSPPDYSEKSPADRSVQRHESIRSISSRNQKIYRAVVENSENSFRVVYFKGVIHRRHQI